MTDETYNGDVTLSGTEDTPVSLHGPEDMYFRADSVNGDLELRNAEYVFTHQQVGSDADMEETETTIRGDLEDGYAKTVSGDTVVEDAEDVFVPANTATGDLSVVGAENVFSDSVETSYESSEYDVSLTGWKQSGSASDPDAGVYVTGARHEVELDKVRSDLEVYVVGHHHDVTITGRRGSVRVLMLGYDNTVTLGPYLSADVVANTGEDNELVEEPYPTEDLIEMSKDEAFGNAAFGRKKVTFQQPADGEDWCPNCGEPADAIIERHQMEALFVFGHPVKTYDRSTNPAKECEHCSPNAVNAELTERERKDVLK